MDSHYSVEIRWSEEDQSFIARVPELAGCMADGETYADALSAVQTVIEDWLETAHEIGRPIPAPRPLNVEKAVA